MFRSLLSAAGQVDEDAGKGVKTENKLANCQVSLACREDTQRGGGGGGRVGALHGPLCSASGKTRRNRSGALIQRALAGILGAWWPYKHWIYSRRLCVRLRLVEPFSFKTEDSKLSDGRRKGHLSTSKHEDA